MHRIGLLRQEITGAAGIVLSGWGQDAMRCQEGSIIKQELLVIVEEVIGCP